MSSYKITWFQFGKADEQIGQITGEEYFNVRMERTDEGKVIEEFGIVYNNGKNATLPGGLIAIYHWIDDKEAEKISKALLSW